MSPAIYAKLTQLRDTRQAILMLRQALAERTRETCAVYAGPESPGKAGRLLALGDASHADLMDIDVLVAKAALIQAEIDLLRAGEELAGEL